MQTLDCIRNRRSVRAYTGEPVTDEEIRELLAAAMQAPSAGNAQPWHFIVIRDKDMLNRCAAIHPYAKMAPKAEAAVLVCADLSLEKYPGFWVQDCSAAIQNLLLAACDMGIGAVWTGIHPLEDRVADFRTLFSLSENIVPLALVPLGRSNAGNTFTNRFREDRIHMETW